jgi:hypothetical protein
MKIYCKGAYTNAPAGLYFSQAGVIEIDNEKAEFLLRDAPENFSRELPTPPPSDSTRFAAGAQATGFDAPPMDKQMKAPVRKK